MFQYHGEVLELTDTLEENRERMTKAYRKVLGEEIFAILETADAQLLGPASFRSVTDLDALSRNPSSETTPGANKFFVAMGVEEDIKFANDGYFTSKRIETAPGFVFGQSGFEGSRGRYKNWVSPYLAPYIHEYDHFLIFTLQEQPMLVAMQIMAYGLEIPRMPFCLEDIEGTVLRKKTRAERLVTAQLLTWAYSFQEFYELSTRILDREIFLEMGLRVPASYFEIQPKFLVPFPIPSANAVVTVVHGDSLSGYSIERRLDTLRHWVRKFISSAQIQANFLESFAKLEIRKCPFAELVDEETQ